MNQVLITVGKNLLKLGVLLVASTALNQSVREATSETIADLTKGIRQAKNHYDEKRNSQVA